MELLGLVAGGLDEDVGMCGEGEDMVEDIVMETEAFVAKYEWRGESIEWFLKAIRRLQTSG